MTTTATDAVPGTTGPDRIEERVRLRDGVYRANDARGRARLSAWPRTYDLEPWNADTADRTVRALTGDPVDPGAADLLPELVADLSAHGWLARTVLCGGVPVYTVHPWDEPNRPRPWPSVPDATVRLGRFTVSHRPDERHLDATAERPVAVVEAPGAWAEIRLHDPAAAAVVADPASARAPYADRLRADLAWAGLTEAADADDFGSTSWSLPERWFADRSRLGHRGYLGDGFGGTFWGRGRYEPLPARRTPYPGTPIPLPQPDLDRLRATDPTLTAVLEDRRSIRNHDPADPLTVAELGEFLYRTCRIRGTFDNDGVSYVRKPYPEGGSVGELEIYPLVTRVAGLAAGLYCYDPFDHALTLVRGVQDPAVRRLALVAKHSTVAWSPPQVTLLFAARVGRLFWKYEGMGYALVLKHVGVLYQTMYCVATAMGLAPCGLGSGDSAGFAAATGQDPAVEPAVGEFALGRPAPEPAGEAA